jgi:hypothetical protein
MNEKKIRESVKQPTLRLPGETITIGPGTVPTSDTSIQSTSIKDMVVRLRRASRLGIFDDAEDEQNRFSGTK